MAQPLNYTPSTSFYDDSRNNAGGRDPVRTDRLDAELDAISESINGSNASLALIQRDDGKLLDQIVEPYALSAATRAYVQGSRFNPRGLWATLTAYALGDLVDYLGNAYVCAIAHTSASFASDYSAGRWQIFTSSPDASGLPFAPTGSISSTNVQDAIVEVSAETKAAINPVFASLYGAI